MGFDPAQRFLRLVAGGRGVLYAVQADGVLRWYRHAGWSSGGASWSNGVGLEIGTDWHQFVQVLASADGQLFGITGDGRVRWYRRQLDDPDGGSGAGGWHPNSGAVIHDGFARFPRVFGGHDGTLYGVAANGTLWWHRYTAGDGRPGPGAWANAGVGQQIGSGFQQYPQLFAAPSGVVFGAEVAGKLWWWRYRAGDGSAGAQAWANNGFRIGIGSGWSADSRQEWTAGADGEIYTVALDTNVVPDLDHQLLWYRLTNYLTVDQGGISSAWAHPDNGVLIGQGFTVERQAALQCYSRRQTLAAGETLEVAVSTTFPGYDARIGRVVPDPRVLRQATVRSGAQPVLPHGYRSTGCGWPAALTLPVTSTWRSGVYTAELEGPGGVRCHALFVVRPTAPQEDRLVVVPTYTYCAYNGWGGHSQYSDGQNGVRRTLTFQRPSTSAEFEPTGAVSHLLLQDLMLLRWMEANGFGFDCCTDADVHERGFDLIGQYPAVVLGTHPEYISDAMRAAFADYVGSGGRLIYTGGNGLYERVQPSADGTSLTFRQSDGGRDIYGDDGLPEHDILGVDFAPDSFLTFAPYRVVDAAHPFLAGTGLAPGDTFGGAAYNGAASGWEADRVPDGGRAHVFAEGVQPFGAQMCRADFAGGGWTFAAGSLCFNGALDDPAVAQILRNVLTAAAV
jgi:N,N-dimethylformamidase